MKLRRRALRIYTYHNRYQEFLDPVEKTPKNVSGLLFNICYYTGLSIIYLIVAPFLALRFGTRKLGGDLGKTQHHLASKIKNLGSTKSWKTSMAVFLLLVFAGSGTFHSLIFAAEAQRVKSRVLGDADLGVQALTAAGASLQGQNPGEAQKHFRDALQNFDKVQSDLETQGLILGGIMKVLPQKADADKLLESAKLASEAGGHIASLYEKLMPVKFTPQGITGAGDKGQNLSAILDEFKLASGKISKATGLLESVDPGLVPSDKREIFLQVQSQLSSIRHNLEIGAELAGILEDILLGQKDILIMFQNNTELRPTGGFLGTFGAMKLNNGSIAKLHISSIYDLDGQLKEAINPPRPLRAVNDRWYLRDANWFVDFPSSAKKITSFYEKEGGTTPDMVIALTPTIVTDLLNITGPITVPNYNVTLNSENFVEQTQLETSVKYDRQLNKPKQFLADFFPLFLQRLSSLKGPQLVAVLSSFQKNLQSKEIMVYSRNQDLQAKLRSFRWTNEVMATDRDYLSIVSANLGGSKTDTAMKQSAMLISQIGPGGDIINTLKLTKSNPLARKDEFKNKSFVRILVPEGSTLISVDGFSPTQVTDTQPLQGIVDNEVRAWEQNSVQDVVSGTLIGKESGKTFFGNWLVLEGGDERTVTITYKLPFRLGVADRLSLLFQKQPGVPAYPLVYRVEHEGRTLEWANKNVQSTDGNTTTFNLTTEIDQLYGLVLGKN